MLCRCRVPTGQERAGDRIAREGRGAEAARPERRRHTRAVAAGVVHARHVPRKAYGSLPHPLRRCENAGDWRSGGAGARTRVSRIGRALQRFPSEPITVMLYTNREFQDLTRAPGWAAGSYDGRIRVSVGGNASEGEIDRVLTHELVHAVIATAGRVPAWLNEGLATHLESSDPGWAATTLRRSATIMPLADLVRGFSGFDEQQAVIAYAESAVAAEVLIAQLGSNLGPFLEMVGRGSPSTRPCSSSTCSPTPSRPSGRVARACDRRASASRDSATIAGGMHRILLSCVLLALGCGTGIAADRPNIIFIMTDDHAAHAISAYGSRVNQTPQPRPPGARGRALRATSSSPTRSARRAAPRSSPASTRTSTA